MSAVLRVETPHNHRRYVIWETKEGNFTSASMSKFVAQSRLTGLTNQTQTPSSVLITRTQIDDNETSASLIPPRYENVVRRLPKRNARMKRNTETGRISKHQKSLHKNIFCFHPSKLNTAKVTSFRLSYSLGTEPEQETQNTKTDKSAINRIN